MAETTEHLLLIHDGARYHTSASTKAFWLYRIWCGGILQICGDGSQFAVLPRLNDRKLSQSGLESLSIVCRRSILMLFSHN
jgi:hypothetical protein